MPGIEDQNEAVAQCSRRFTLSDLNFEVRDVVRGLGYSVAEPAHDRRDPGQLPQANPPEHILHYAEQLLALGRTLIKPVAQWKRIPIQQDVQNESLVCQDPYVGTLHVGQLIQRQLNAAREMAVFVVSIGSQLEIRAREMMSAGAALEGYILDTIGSIAVEAVADALELEVKARVAEENWHITNRFSPGYCSWTTSGQQALFALLGDATAGVTLGDSSLMYPIKSISGVIGLGPSVQHRPYPCDVCTITACQQRLNQARL